MWPGCAAAGLTERRRPWCAAGARLRPDEAASQRAAVAAAAAGCAKADVDITTTPDQPAHQGFGSVRDGFSRSMAPRRLRLRLGLASGLNLGIELG